MQISRHYRKFESKIKCVQVGENLNYITCVVNRFVNYIFSREHIIISDSANTLPKGNMNLHHVTYFYPCDLKNVYDAS